MNTLILIRKIGITLLGMITLIIGFALIFLPGPAFIFIPLGLTILSLEFLWAKKIRQKMVSILKKLGNNKKKNKLI